MLECDSSSDSSSNSNFNSSLNDWEIDWETKREELKRLFRRAEKNEQDVEDMVQVTLLLAVRHLPGLKAKEAMNGYIKKIALSVLNGWHRPRYRTELTNILQKIDDPDAPDEDKIEASFDFIFHQETKNPEDLLIRKIDMQQLHQALNSLSQRERTLLTLYYLLEISQKEIGSILNMTVGSVKVAMQRARENLKRCVDDL